MTVKVQQIDQCRWRIPREGAMRTEGLVFASRAMMAALQKEQALEQVRKRRNLARDCWTLFGHAGHSLGLWFSHRRGGGF